MGFEKLDTYYKVNTKGTWVEVDLSAVVPGDAAAAIFTIDAYDDTHIAFGMRKPGNTDSLSNFINRGQCTYGIVGLVEQKFEIAIASTGAGLFTHPYVTGYITDDICTMLTTYQKITTPNATWQTCTVTDYSIPSGVSAVILQYVDPTGNKASTLDYRLSGSSDDLTSKFDYEHNWMIVGVSSNAFEYKDVGFGGFFPDVYIIGYITLGVTYFTDMVDITPGTLDAYTEVDLNALAGVPTSAKYALIAGTKSVASCGIYLREYGKTEDFWATTTTTNRVHATVPVNEGKIEIKLEDVGVSSIYLKGYCATVLGGDNWARVASITHVYAPGSYYLEAGLGDVSAVAPMIGRNPDDPPLNVPFFGGMGDTPYNYPGTPFNPDPMPTVINSPGGMAPWMYTPITPLPSIYDIPGATGTSLGGFGLGPDPAPRQADPAGMSPGLSQFYLNQVASVDQAWYQYQMQQQNAAVQAATGLTPSTAPPAQGIDFHDPDDTYYYQAPNTEPNITDEDWWQWAMGGAW